MMIEIFCILLNIYETHKSAELPQVIQKNTNPKVGIFTSGEPTRTLTWDQSSIRADIQRKPLGFQELTSHKYRCVSFCVTNLMKLQEKFPHSMVSKTKGNLEQPSNTSLLQSVFYRSKRYFKSSYVSWCPGAESN